MASVVYESALERLLTTLRGKELAVFAGAGISFHSGLPLVSHLVPYLLGCLGASDDEVVRIGASGLPFEALMETLLDYSDLTPVLGIFDKGQPNATHRLLARLMVEGHLRTLVTTNFDCLLEVALEECGFSEGRDYELILREQDFGSIEWGSGRRRLIKIHGGTQDKAAMAITIRRVAAESVLGPRMRLLADVFGGCRGHSVVWILGYSCSDTFDVLPAIRGVCQGRKEVILVDHDLQNERVDTLGSDVFHGYPGVRVCCDTDLLVEGLWKRIGLKEKYLRRNSMVDWKACVEAWFKHLDSESPQSKFMIMGHLLRKVAAFQSALSYLERSFLEARRRGSKKEELVALADLALLCEQRGKHKEAEIRCKLALPVAVRAKDSSALYSLCVTCASSLVSQGRYFEAEDLYRKALAAARKLGAKDWEAIQLGNLGGTALAQSDLDRAEQFYRSAQSVYEDLGDAEGMRVVLGSLGLLYRHRGDHALALEVLRQGLGLATRMGDLHGRRVLLGHLGLVHSDLGDQDEAHAAYTEALEIARSSGDTSAEGRMLWYLGCLHAERSDHRGAVVSLLTALSLLQGELEEEARDLTDLRSALRQQVVLFGEEGLRLERLGQYDEAKEAYDLVLRVATELGDEALAEAATANLGNVFVVAGLLGRALEHYEEALRISQVLGAREREGGHRGNLACVYLLQGQYELSRQELVKALRIASEAADEEGRGVCLANLGSVSLKGGRFRDAIQYCERSLAVLRPLRGQEARIAEVEATLSRSHVALRQLG